MDQKFYYLSKGSQVYAFESEDHEIILKFIRQHKYKTPFWMDLFPSLKKHLRGESRLNKYLESYRLAYEKLADETAVIYLHLAGEFPKKLLLVDACKREFEVDASEIVFILQKKGKVLPKEMTKLKGQKEELFNLLQNFLKLENKLHQKSIVDHDPHALKNSAIVEDEVIRMDLGNFKYFHSTERSVHLFLKKIKKFRNWLVKNRPDLIKEFDAAVKNEIASRKSDER